MNILALTDLRGQIHHAERLPEVCRNAAVHAVMFMGNVVAGEARFSA